jgi:acetoin:2,6-dichlorophenolindophenol oxidoreductase subunit alpha
VNSRPLAADSACDRGAQRVDEETPRAAQPPELAALDEKTLRAAQPPELAALDEKTLRAAQRPELAALDDETLRTALARMHVIRKFEEVAEASYMRGLVHGTMHLSIGQEASAVGAVLALRADDYILSTHRGHGHCIAKGADPARMLAELFGKETGYCRGRGGSMHIADIEGGNLGANGIVAGGLPIAVGVGMSIKAQRQDRVCMVFFGDGAANEGAFHEALNMASIWKLPVVFVCENNQYAMSMDVARAMAVANVADRAASYAMPGVAVDGNDLPAVAAAARDAVMRARSGDGPSLVECKTYRLRGHSKSDRNLYRTRDEIDAWRRRDPIARLESELAAQGRFTTAALADIAKAAEATIERALAFAKASPDPDPAELTRDVYAD